MSQWCVEINLRLCREEILSSLINAALIPLFIKHMQAQQAYEAQVSSLLRGMSRLEEELSRAKEEKSGLVSDLASVRELCVKLDSGKELTVRKLTTKSMDLERVRPAHTAQSILQIY